MRRLLLLLAVLALGALAARFVTRSRVPLPAPSVAPSERAAGASAIESVDSGVPTRQAQASTPAVSSAAAPAARIHGRVFFEGTREPVARAPIQIRYRVPGRPESQGKLSSTDTSADGSYSVSVPGGVQLCEACVPARSSRPYAGHNYSLRSDAYIASTQDLGLRVAQGDIELDLHVGVGLSLSGLVCERVGGRPITGAEVIFQVGMFDAFGTSSGADGRFTMRGITLEGDRAWSDFMLRAIATSPDYVRQELVVRPLDERGHWPELTFELDTGVVVEGIVRDAQGEPVWGLDLRLRPVRGAPMPGVTEFEGEWATRSDGDGAFRFPRVQHFDRAWIVTDRKARPRLLHAAETVSWNGASRALLRGDDPNLRSIDLRLKLEVAVDVDVHYPDGTPAGPEERLLLSEDENGHLRSAREGSQFVCLAGRATRIVAWGKPRAQDEEGVIYRGETVLSVPSTGAGPHAQIRLARTALEPREYAPVAFGAADGAGEWTNSAITLRFVDRATGLPVTSDTNLSIERRTGTMACQFGGREAALRLHLEPGWETLRLTIGGYQAYTIELEVKDNEPQDLTLPLERLR